MYKFIIFSLCVAAVVAHPAYQLLIPNGAAVPDPCTPGSIWLAVGHYDPIHHTHEKNPFALAFAAAGHVYGLLLYVRQTVTVTEQQMV